MGRSNKRKNQKKQQQTPVRLKKPLLEFYGAVVNEFDLQQNNCCPVCEEVNATYKKIRDIEDEESALRDLMVGEVLSCDNCGSVIISMVYPIYDLPEPIFLDWSIFNAKPPEMGNPNETQTGSSTLTVVTSGVPE